MHVDANCLKLDQVAEDGWNSGAREIARAHPVDAVAGCARTRSASGWGARALSGSGRISDNLR